MCLASTVSDCFNKACISPVRNLVSRPPQLKLITNQVLAGILVFYLLFISVIIWCSIFVIWTWTLTFLPKNVQFNMCMSARCWNVPSLSKNAVNISRIRCMMIQPVPDTSRIWKTRHKALGNKQKEATEQIKKMPKTLNKFEFAHLSHMKHRHLDNLQICYLQLCSPASLKLSP